MLEVDRDRAPDAAAYPQHAFAVTLEQHEANVQKARQCGACTVLVDGRRVVSCLTLAVMNQGKAITTIEGLADGPLHPVQQAFIDHDAFQCGYCTPGQIMSAVGLIQEGRTRSDDEIRENMSGNLCRCGAYVNIVEAIKDAVARGLDPRAAMTEAVDAIRQESERGA